MTISRLMFVVALLFTALATPATLLGRPNIVFIFADDLGYGDFGSYGATKISTPHTDRLAREGRRFTQAHTPSAVCSPTRFGILTGTYPWREGRVPRHLLPNEPLTIREGEKTLPGLLRSNGYSTAAFGKWHLGVQRKAPVDWNRPLRPGPLDAGFDEYFGVITSHNQAPFLWTEGDRVLGVPAGEKLVVEGLTQKTLLDHRRDDTTIGPTLAAKVVDFIERHSEDPFFIYYASCAVHTPHTPAPFMQGKSGVGVYGDFVQEFDWQVGQVLETLDRLGLTENTLVIVTSDNGAVISWGDEYGHRVNGALRSQKATIYEGGHRVPFLARWPGKIPAGTVSDEVISLVDMMATLVAAAGADLPADAGPDSHNLLPELLGQAGGEPLREATVVSAKFDVARSIQQGPWKLILPLDPKGVHELTRDYRPGRFGPTEPELYQLDDDPGETRNRFAEEPAVVARLKALMERFESQGYSRPEYHAREDER